MPRFYSTILTDTLKQRVEDCLDAAPSDQISLFEELALLRATMADSILMWDAAHRVNGDKGNELRMAAGEVMRDGLKQVKEMVEAAARVEAVSKATFNVHALAFVINQVVRIAYEVMNSHPGLAERFEHAIRERIKIPDQTGGTTLTPDQDVLEMDDTVPEAVEG